MVDGSDSLEAQVLLEFASNAFEMCTEYLGDTILSWAADTTWRRLNWIDGGAVSVSQALASMSPAHEGEQQKLWNLVTTYELWSGHILLAR